jgi:hypothetical protein
MMPMRSFTSRSTPVAPELLRAPSRTSRCDIGERIRAI